LEVTGVLASGTRQMYVKKQVNLKERSAILARFLKEGARLFLATELLGRVGGGERS
jgi:hypothetical protein